MTIDADERRRLVRARGAVFCLFASFGIVIASWAVHLPSVKQATGVSTSLLGVVLLLVGVGALAGMQLSGALVDRFGSGRIGVLGVAAMAVALIPPLAANAWWPVVAGAFFLGVATGIAEVGINAAAVDVERDYGRPIIASFHAVFSVGNVLGALIGAAAFALGAGVLATAVAVAAIACAAVGAAATVLVGYRFTQDDGSSSDAAAVTTQQPSPGGRARGAARCVGVSAVAGRGLGDGLEQPARAATPRSLGVCGGSRARLLRRGDDGGPFQRRSDRRTRRSGAHGAMGVGRGGSGGRDRRGVAGIAAHLARVSGAGIGTVRRGSAGVHRGRQSRWHSGQDAVTGGRHRLPGHTRRSRTDRVAGGPVLPQQRIPNAVVRRCDLRMRGMGRRAPAAGIGAGDLSLLEPKPR
jgi:hypothetical protein